jgi:hypothetical protein
MAYDIANQYKYLVNKDLFGGEGGIRTQSAPVESVTYRFQIASVAVKARVAVGPCSFLPDEGLKAIDEIPPFARMRRTAETPRFEAMAKARKRPSKRWFRHAEYPADS